MTREQLLSFHFGALNEAERLEIERELLVDPESLLDYLELKRALEAAVPVPATPSPRLFARFNHSWPRKKHWFLLGGAGVAAAMAALVWVLHRPPAATEPSPFPSAGILFDRGGEQSAAANVL